MPKKVFAVTKAGSRPGVVMLDEHEAQLAQLLATGASVELIPPECQVYLPKWIELKRIVNFQL